MTEGVDEALDPVMVSVLNQADPEAVRDTLEPKGSGRRLSIKADLPGIVLIVIGSVLLLSVAI